MKRNLLVTVALLCALSSPLVAQIFHRAGEPFLRPPFLQEGDSVGLVNISSKCPDNPKLYDSLIDQIRSWGVHVRQSRHLFDRPAGWFPAADSVRASDLQELLDAPDIRAILFFRGGYGALRTFKYLDLRRFRRDPKWLVGYSDVTGVHALMRRLGVESIHGTMPISFSQKPVEADSSMLSLRAALFGEVTQYRVPPDTLNQYGRATGRLTGGNLSLIYSMRGTDLDVLVQRNSVLLIEDVAESAYAIDRMLQNLWQSGMIHHIRAILVGHFTGTKNEKNWGCTVQQLIHRYTSQLNIPVIFNFPAGHEQPNFSLYMGRKVEVEVDSTGGVVRFL